MTAVISLVDTTENGRRPGLDLGDHPVFQALPPQVQSRAQSQGVLMHIAAGQTLAEDGHLTFVLSGVLGLFPNGGRICVAAVVAGSVHGWDQALHPECNRPEARALTDTLACRTPAASVIDGLGRDWLNRLVALQSSLRLMALAEEAACNGSHCVQERLAKWLVRLHCGANGAPLGLTQADFGAMLGVQRTSINAAAGRLQEKGLVKFGRGKVQILDLPGLRSASCGCGGGTPLPSTRPSPTAMRPAEPSSWAPPVEPTAA
ncbi:Crp/Fnr family transcriptional regulator [Brevundimonas sp.]|uniref:Crp/Fnr family transcriptional regulator n=1 Tax=Brevundimonas sp. TaxID=1871086 RepID=UPI0028A78939|nr:Crp/Fnr family transcriptional regulator [Brevundimonas sp.]